jgi:hypothetical protein
MSDRTRGYFVVSQVRPDDTQGIFWDPNEPSNTLTGILQGGNDGERQSDVSLTNGGRFHALDFTEAKKNAVPEMSNDDRIVWEKGDAMIVKRG